MGLQRIQVNQVDAIYQDDLDSFHIVRKFQKPITDPLRIHCKSLHISNAIWKAHERSRDCDLIVHVNPTLFQPDTAKLDEVALERLSSGSVSASLGFFHPGIKHSLNLLEVTLREVSFLVQNCFVVVSSWIDPLRFALEIPNKTVPWKTSHRTGNHSPPRGNLVLLPDFDPNQAKNQDQDRKVRYITHKSGSQVIWIGAAQAKNG
mmetsp:Transcript_15388/g.28272  ORF Transcript_15388/g.28272 Transcript_15388/m.28272 type:complete len:205 (+) Transcript_15388:973-1587(+)